MRTKVTDSGILIPKHWLEGINEVEIRKENNSIVIVPIQIDDPLLDLGSEPITADVSDASINHDRYVTNV